MRANKVVKKLCGLGREVVVRGFELDQGTERARLVVWVRPKVRARGRCGRCGTLATWFDNGDGERRWRHVDVGFATCELVSPARRVDCVTTAMGTSP